jgi:hypothetical protein
MGTNWLIAWNLKENSGDVKEIAQYVGHKVQYIVRKCAAIC